MNTSILIVDDSAFARRLVRHSLEGAAFDIHEASSGAEALEQYALLKPHVVLLDLLMNGMDGSEVLTNIRAMDPKANVIVATADIQDATRDEVLRLGAREIVNKPFTPAELLAAIQRAAQRPAA
jgi:two-component system chemotaxis response regulator CheY